MIFDTTRFKVLTRIDIGFVLAILALLGAGIAFIYSASARNPESALSEMASRQIVWAVAGAVLFLSVVLLDYRRIEELSVWLYGAALIGLLLVFLIGKEKYGAARWISLFGLQVQPSEFAKLGTLVLLAAFLSHPARDPTAWRTIAGAFAILGVPLVMILKQPDLGTSLTLVPMGLAILLAAGVPWRVFGMLAAAGLLLMPLGWFVLEDYQRTRILVFLNPERDPLNSGWNTLQSAIAVGSGGWTGKGYLMGTQNVLGFLPRTVAPTDFIFSVIAEETGFAGSLVLLALFACVIGGGIRAALGARDRFGRLLAVGTIVLIFFHIFVNMAMTIGLMPITGIPLPLLSYGGSFMVCTLTLLGLLQSVHVRRVRR